MVGPINFARCEPDFHFGLFDYQEKKGDNMGKDWKILGYFVFLYEM